MEDGASTGTGSPNKIMEPACALSSGLQAPQLLLSSERSPRLQLGRGLTVYLPRSPATGCLLRSNRAGTPL
ncbi:unnamed protein product [Arctogadus glacialis]